MKNIFFAVFSVVLLLCTSCTKEDSFDKNQEIDTELSKIGDPTLNIKIVMKMHRQISIRPRDNVPCGCAACWGLCNGTITGGIGWSLVNTDVNNNGSVAGEGFPCILTDTDNGKAKIYFTAPMPAWSETDFVIDNSLTFEQTVFPFLPVTSLELLSGTYSSYQKTGTIDSGGTTYNYYGYVVVSSTQVL